MYYLIFTLIIECFIVLTCIGIQLRLFALSEKESIHLLYGKKHRWIVGMAASGILTLISILLYAVEAEWSILYIAVTSIYLPFYRMISWIRHIIIYDEYGFTQGFIPGFKKCYRYEDITEWKYNKYKEILFMGNKKISFDKAWIESNEFIDFALWKYRHIYGENPPTDDNLKVHDLFGGNVEDPNEKIQLAVIFLIFTLSLPCTAIYRIWDTIDETNSDYMEISFESYEIDDTLLTLRSEGYKQPFRIWEYTEYDEYTFEQFFEKIESGETFRVYAKYIGGRGSSSYIIYNLCDEAGEVYVCFDKANAIDKNYFQESLPFTWFLPAGWILVCVITVIVVRNKKRFEVIFGRKQLVEKERKKSYVKDKKRDVFLAYFWKYGYWGMMVLILVFWGNEKNHMIILGMAFIIYGIYSILISIKPSRHFVIGMLEGSSQGRNKYTRTHDYDSIRKIKRDNWGVSILVIMLGLLLLYV